MNNIDNTDEFKVQVASLGNISGPEKLLLVALLQQEQEMETQGTEFRFREGINKIIDNYLDRREKESQTQ